MTAPSLQGDRAKAEKYVEKLVEYVASKRICLEVCPAVGETVI